MRIPGMILRRLYTNGSLQNVDGGVRFEVKNRLSDATLTRISEIKINDGGNSGLYFRTTRKPGFTDGYEAQIDSTHTDPIRTGSLYGMCHVYKQWFKPDTWFTYEIEVRDDVWRRRAVTRWPPDSRMDVAMARRSRSRSMIRTTGSAHCAGIRWRRRRTWTVLRLAGQPSSTPMCKPPSAIPLERA